MKSKILIDVDEQGLPTILIDHGQETQLEDVRDKLVKRFLEGGCCALVTVNEDQTRTIITMTPIDMLQNIADMFKSEFFPDPSEESKKRWKEFEQHLLSAASMLESLGYRSNAFHKAVEKQKA